MGRPPRVGGLRSTAARDVADEPTALPDKRKGFAFRSRAAALRLSLRRRRVLRGPDGEAIEEAPRSKADNPLDWVMFENNFYETDDAELAALIQSKEGYGLGREFWSLDDEKAAQDVALENELRARIASRPDIADRVFRPSNSEDFALPPKAEA